MECTSCGWPIGEATVLSTHRISRGWIRYRRCVCGTVSIELLTLNIDTEGDGYRTDSEPVSVA